MGNQYCCVAREELLTRYWVDNQQLTLHCKGTLLMLTRRTEAGTSDFHHYLIDLSTPHCSPTLISLFSQVEGSIEKGQTVLDLPRIEGKWDESLTAFMPDGSKQLIWKTSAPAKDPTRHRPPHSPATRDNPLSKQTPGKIRADHPHRARNLWHRLQAIVRS